MLKLYSIFHTKKVQALQHNIQHSIWRDHGLVLLIILHFNLYFAISSALISSYPSYTPVEFLFMFKIHLFLKAFSEVDMKLSFMSLYISYLYTVELLISDSFVYTFIFATRLQVIDSIIYHIDTPKSNYLFYTFRYCHSE